MAVKRQCPDGTATSAAGVVIADGHVCAIRIGSARTAQTQTTCGAGELNGATAPVAGSVERAGIDDIGAGAQGYGAAATAAIVRSIEGDGSSREVIANAGQLEIAYASVANSEGEGSGAAAENKITQARQIEYGAVIYRAGTVIADGEIARDDQRARVEERGGSLEAVGCAAANGQVSAEGEAGSRGDLGDMPRAAGAVGISQGSDGRIDADNVVNGE